MTTSTADRVKVRALLPMLAPAMAQRARAERSADAPDYTADPVRWITTKLGAHLWTKQCDIANAVVAHRRVAVRSAHSMGKSYLAARLMAWWMDTRPVGEAFVVTTAPDFNLVRAVLWREARRAHATGHLPGVMNQTEWQINGELVAYGRKPADYEATGLQGIHARYVLVIIDEAAGVAESIFQAAGSLASNAHSRILAIGNPTDPDSHFARICAPGTDWHALEVDGRQSPNFTDEKIPDDLRDLLLSPVYAAELARDYGEDSPIYQSRICAQFPDNVVDALLRLSWLEAARYREPTDAGDWEAGVDVAGPGEDETVVCIRQGATIRALLPFHTPDSRGDVLAALQPYRDRLLRVKVDSAGTGYYFGRHLEDHGYRGRVVDVNVGESPTEGVDETGKPVKERYANLKAELYWGLRQRFAAGEVAGLSDAPTLAQLASIRYGHTAQGKVAIEKKEDARKRGVKSPDRAEAVMLAYAPLMPARAGVWWA